MAKNPMHPDYHTQLENLLNAFTLPKGLKQICLILNLKEDRGNASIRHSFTPFKDRRCET